MARTSKKATPKVKRTDGVTPEWKKILDLIPGYSPFGAKGYHFNAEAANLRIEFIEEFCTFTQGIYSGRPFKLQPWQKSFIANLYGWVDEHGLRRYRRGLLFIPCGNGKSELAAALICAALFLPDDPEEPGGHIYSAAGKKDQTKYIFEPVKAMIKASPQMQSRAKILLGSIQVGQRIYYPMARETHQGTEHGGATHFAVVDELHAHLDNNLVVALQRGMVKRAQPMMIVCTTSDSERPRSPCNLLHEYACKVRDKVIDDPTFLPMIYEAPKDCDWLDPKVWKACNPNWGISVHPRNFEALANQAKSDPAFELEFKRLHLNIRTTQTATLVQMNDWLACTAEEEPDLTGLSCYAGLDIGSNRDLTAFVAVFPLPNGYYYIKPIFWVAIGAAQNREKKDRVSYTQWIQQGAIRAVPGEVMDTAYVRSDIIEFASKYPIVELAVDRLWQGEETINRLSDAGLTVFAHGQQFSDLALPTRQWLDAISARTLTHSDDPVLRWMVSNTVGKTNGEGAIKPDKRSSGAKIDGVIAMIMAFGRAVLGRNREAGKSWYETHELEHISL